MKKLPLVAVAAIMLLASCGGNNDSATSTGGDSTDSVPNSAISEDRGKAKLAAINQAMATTFGNKCIEVTGTTTISEATVEISGVSATVSGTTDSLAQYDTVDGVSYTRNDATMTTTVSLMVTETKTLSEVWVFDGKMATKNTTTMSLAGSQMDTVEHQVADYSGLPVSEEALGQLVQTGTAITGGTWESVSYYAGSGDTDLRIVATNGAIGELTVTNYEVIYIAGLPTTIVMDMNVEQSLGEGGGAIEMPTVSTMNFSYPDSIDITTPDLSSSEWANA